VPDIRVRWSGYSWLACLVNDYDEETHHRRGLTRAHAISRVLAALDAPTP
jgi:hypothetical protein